LGTIYPDVEPRAPLKADQFIIGPLSTLHEASRKSVPNLLQTVSSCLLCLRHRIMTNLESA